MSEDLLRLAEMVEGLTGPDREVGCLIFQAIGAPVPFQFASKLVALSFDEVEQCYFAPIGDMRVRYEPPAYTASIDVAMTLVPEGLSFEVRSSGTGDKGQATIWNPLKAVGQQEWRVTGCKTPALALCAAALRARASIGKGE